jgi:hypothetical protein
LQATQPAFCLAPPAQEIEDLERKAVLLEELFQNTATASVKGLTAAVKSEKGALPACGLARARAPACLCAAAAAARLDGPS